MGFTSFVSAAVVVCDWRPIEQIQIRLKIQSELKNDKAKDSCSIVEAQGRGKGNAVGIRDLFAMCR